MKGFSYDMPKNEAVVPHLTKNAVILKCWISSWESKSFYTHTEAVDNQGIICFSINGKISWWKERW